MSNLRKGFLFSLCLHLLLLSVAVGFARMLEREMIEDVVDISLLGFGGSGGGAPGAGRLGPGDSGPGTSGLKDSGKTGRELLRAAAETAQGALQQELLAENTAKPTPPPPSPAPSPAPEPEPEAAQAPKPEPEAAPKQPAPPKPKPKPEPKRIPPAPTPPVRATAQANALTETRTAATKGTQTKETAASSQSGSDKGNGTNQSAGTGGTAGMRGGGEGARSGAGGEDQGGSGGTLSGGAYFNRIHGLVRKHLQYPRQARRMGMTGTAHYAFTIETNGAVSNAALVKSCGFGILDEAGLKAIRQASPFPPPPKRSDIVMPIDFRLR